MPAVTIIDGHSGSGKTSLAECLADRSGAQLLRLDSLYPGWGGLAEGSRMVAEVLGAGTYRRYDWQRKNYAESHSIDPTVALVIEGCGSLTRENIAAAREWAGPHSRLHTVWLQCPEAVRKHRALTRDGEMFRPHWQYWAEQEEAHFTRVRPIALATEIVHTDLPSRARG